MVLYKTYPTVFRFTVFFFVLISTLFSIVLDPFIEIICYDYRPTVVKIFFLLNKWIAFIVRRRVVQSTLYYT